MGTYTKTMKPHLLLIGFYLVFTAMNLTLAHQVLLFGFLKAKCLIAANQSALT